MSITGQVKKDMIAAMKAGEKERLSALRMILSQLQLGEKEAGGEFGEADELKVLTAEKKRRQQAAEAFREGGRVESAEKEEAEAAIIDGYLPRGLSGEELERIVDEEIEAAGAVDASEMGRVMSAVMPRIAGRADGKAVSAIVRKKLSGGQGDRTA